MSESNGTTAKTPEILDAVSTLYADGIDRLAQVQKKGLDFATQANNEILQSWKKIALAVPGAPGLMMLDLASSAFERYADTQKGAIDLVLTQSNAMLGVVKEGLAATAQANAVSTGVIQKTVQESVAAQKRALDESAAQSKAAFEKAKSQMGISGTPAETAADTLQMGVQSLIENQKSLLDFAARPLGTPAQEPAA
jgi:hypothetical protein